MSALADPPLPIDTITITTLVADLFVSTYIELPYLLRYATRNAVFVALGT